MAAPLSFAQQRLWFLDRLEPGGLQYLVPWAWRLSGPLDVELLAAALGRVVARHEILRTRFAEVDGQPSQLVEETVEVALPVTDLTPWRVDEYVAELMEQPFDLEVAPHWRARVLRLAPDEHVLITIWHHAVIDAWSAGILLREMSAAYRAALAGEEPDLPPIGFQYRDFAEAQRIRLAGEGAAGQLAYWRGKLAGLPILDLPTDRPRGRSRSAAGDAVPFTVPPVIVDGLRELARNQRVTLFMVLLAAFQVLLARYAGQDDVAVGTPLANRNHAETEPLIGFFLNTLVLRTDLSGDPSFAELLRRVRETTLDAYDNEDLPFEQLVEALRPERDLARTPLFQAMFLVNNVQAPDWDLPGVRTEEYPLTVGRAKFDLTLAFHERPERLDGFLRYGTALFDRDRIERMTGHLRNLLAAVVVDPDLPLSRLPMLGAAERQRLLYEWNGTTSGERLPGAVHELVELSAAGRPGASAVTEQGGDTVSYGALNAWANRLARTLRNLGAGPEVVVGVHLRPSIRAVVSMLAVLKSGAAYVALDPDLPAARIRFLLADTAAALVVSDSGAGLPAELGDRLVPFGEFAGQEPGDPGFPVHPDGLAYIAYTSGSSGTPKGVQATHRGVVSHLRHLCREYRLGEGDTMLTLAGLGFDASVREIFGALAAGAHLVVPESKEPAAVVRLAVAAGVTVLPSVVPSLLYELAAVPVAEGELARVRLVLCAGERLSADRLTGCGWLAGKVVNQFGPTETTMTTTRQPLPSSDTFAYQVGTPVPDTRVYVLDRAMNPCPAGVPGELLIGGAGVARGYRGRPAPTAAAFVPDPFTPGARLYRTGDLCRWSADGVLEFLGRADRQVKVRGVRVEPGEVEARLLTHPRVGEAVVTTRELPSGEEGLVAYLVPRDGNPAVRELRAWLGEVLPSQFVPGAFVFLDGIPRTANGKTDPAALPSPRGTGSSGSSFVAPRSGVEETIARVWRRRLRLDRVGVFDNFFELGGHSLLAGRVVADLAAAGVRVPLRALFETPTVSALAARASAGPGVAGLVPLNSAESPAVLYCLHDGAGELTGYREIARLLDPGCSVVGVEFDPGSAVGADPIRALAAEYTGRIRRHQAMSYAICGWSLGGVLAYEVASLLTRAGERVVATVLLDAPVPDPESDGQRRADAALDALVAWSRRGGEPDPGVLARLRELGVGEQVLSFGDKELHELLARMSALRTAKNRYRPDPADLTLTVLRAADSQWPIGQFERWRGLVRSTEFAEVPGDHFSLLGQTGARTIADTITKLLDGPG